MEADVTLAAEAPQAGRPVALAQLEAALGGPAYRVWRVLLTAVDARGENWMLRATLATRAGLRTDSHTKRALERLTAWGLVGAAPWRRKRRAGRGHGVTVRARKVFGALGPSAGWALVPLRTFAMVTRKPPGVAITRAADWPTDSVSMGGAQSVLPSEAHSPAGAAGALPISAKLRLPGIPARPALRLARIPAPPPLPEDDYDAAEWLVRLYADLRLRRGHQRFGWRGPLRKQKWWSAVKAGVAALRERDLPPVPWLGWSFALWGGKGAPPLAWVLSPSRMDERAGWFLSEADGVAFGGRVVSTPSAAALWERWRAMENALYRIGVAPPNVLVAVATGHLTVEDAAELTAAANNEAEQAASDLRAAVQEGRWVWD